VGSRHLLCEPSAATAQEQLLTLILLKTRDEARKKFREAEQKFYIDLALLLSLVIKKYISLK
jgi:hypothetical protein